MCENKEDQINQTFESFELFESFQMTHSQLPIFGSYLFYVNSIVTFEFEFSV